MPKDKDYYSLRSKQTDAYISWKDRDDSNNGRITYHSLDIPSVILLLGLKDMNDKEELFAKFFNGTMNDPVVDQMSIEELDVWLDELEKIVLEGRAKTQAVSEKKRLRIANLSESEREKLLSKTPPLVSDALNAVKKRKDRMSKADKLYETLLATGMSEADARKISGTVKIDESKQQIPMLPVSEKTYVFNGTPEKIDTHVCIKCTKEFDTNRNVHFCPECEEKVENEKAKTLADKIVEKTIKEAKKSVENEKPFDPLAFFGK